MDTLLFDPDSEEYHHFIKTAVIIYNERVPNHTNLLITHLSENLPDVVKEQKLWTQLPDYLTEKQKLICLILFMDETELSVMLTHSVFAIHTKDPDTFRPYYK